FNRTAKCSCCVRLNKSCHSVLKKYSNVLREIQKTSLIFFCKSFLTSLKKLMKIFTKKIEIYNRKIKKSADFRRDAEDASIERDLIEMLQKIENHLNDFVKLKKYKIEMSMKKIRDFNTKAKR